MSTSMPPQPEPQMMPPQMPPAKKGTSPIVWILAGCGGILLIGAIVVSLVLWWGARKIKDFAEEAQKNPAIATAKILIAANPELEVVGEDPDKGTLTIRNTKTGEIITMNAEDIKEGKLTFTNEKGQEVTFQGSAEEGKQGLTVTSPEGTMTFGSGGDQQRPSWVPEYPGTTAVSAVTKTGDDGLYGNYSFVTNDPIDKVVAHFVEALEGEGFKVEKTNVNTAGFAMATIQAKLEDGARTVDIGIIPVEKALQVTVQYTEKPAGAGN